VHQTGETRIGSKNGKKGGAMRYRGALIEYAGQW